MPTSDRIGIEARAPERFRKDHDAVVAFVLLFRKKCAAEHRFNAQKREEIVGNIHTGDGRRLTSRGEVDTIAAHQQRPARATGIVLPIRVRAPG